MQSSHTFMKSFHSNLLSREKNINSQRFFYVATFCYCCLQSVVRDIVFEKGGVAVKLIKQTLTIY